MDSETMALSCMNHNLTHRAATLSKMADELDDIASEIERAPEKPKDGDKGEAGCNAKSPRKIDRSDPHSESFFS